MRGWQGFADAVDAAAPAHLEACRAALQDSNAFLGCRSLRRYQDGLLADGHFIVPSPFAGAPVAVEAGFVRPTASIFYVFGGDPPFGVLAEETGRGYPLGALVTEGGWTALDDGTLRQRPEALRDLLGQARQRGQAWRAVAPTRAIVGHRNFAHGLWNEFPALDLASRRGRVFSVAPIFDPLRLFRRHAAREGLDTGPVATSGTYTGWSDRPVTHLGAIHCGEDARIGMQALLFSAAMPRPDTRPTVYFSVRESGRTMVNQKEFIRTVCRRLAQATPGLRVLIDGFSVPADLADPIYDPLRDDIRAKVARTRKLTAALQRSIGRIAGLTVTDLTGLDLLTALPVIGTASFYVVHPGTSHHKIGWVFPIPGVMHGNSENLSVPALRWHARQVCGVRVPVGLPAELVETLDTTDQRPRTMRNMDYRVTDVDAAAEFVVREWLASRAGGAVAGPSPP